MKVYEVDAEIWVTATITCPHCQVHMTSVHIIGLRRIRCICNNWIDLNFWTRQTGSLGTIEVN